MTEISRTDDLPIQDLVKALLVRVSSYDWLRKGLLYSLLLALVVRLTQKKRSVKGKLVLVTGAATGIGRQQAFSFARAGARLALWDINVEQLEKTAEEVRQATGAEVQAYRCNLADREDIYEVAEQVKADQGHVWCLINNAGIISGQNLLDTPDRRIELSMQVNAMAYFWTTKAFLKNMIDNNDGHIVGISSAAGIFPNPRMVDYCTSKFAARGFIEALHTELLATGKTGVKTTCILPAHINTDLFKGFNMMGAMEPEWVANQVLKAVQESKYIVMLPWALQLGVFWQTVMPSSVWDFFMSFSHSAMKTWSPDQANKIFVKMDEKV